jgi:hypothetical protein
LLGQGRNRFSRVEGILSRQSDLDNHANQLNRNNETYWESRGEDDRPDDWEQRSGQKENEAGEELAGDKQAGK